MPRRPLTPRRTIKTQEPVLRVRLVPRWVAIAAPLALLIGILSWVFGPGDPARHAARAESAAQSGDWEAALKEWRAVNRTRQASAQSLLSEARACLALGRAAQAERALVRANEAAPADPAP